MKNENYFHFENAKIKSRIVLFQAFFGFFDYFFSFFIIFEKIRYF